MKELISKLSEIENVKGVWWISKKSFEQKLNIPLTEEAKKKFEDLLQKISTYLKHHDEELGCMFDYDFLLFRKINDGWVVIWGKKDSRLSLIRMEINVILQDMLSQKKKIFKKIRFWK